MKSGIIYLLSEEKLRILIAGYASVPADRLDGLRYVVEDWLTSDGISIGIKVRFEEHVPDEIAKRIGDSDTLHIPI